MTPFNNAEAKIMEDIATLKSQMNAVAQWRISVDEKDHAQDRALFKIESDQRNLETRHEQLMSILKWTLGFAVATFLSSGLDSIIWNLSHHFGGK